ncbi:MAG: metal ABC transporter solute-binding protein, Zn/Mn family, partial [Stackebrandtia sp.]
MSPPLSRLAAIGAAALVAAGALAACGDDAADADVNVVASFYPLQFAAERVGGDHAGVFNLTPSGAEAHDLELEPEQMAEITDADVVLY